MQIRRLNCGHKVCVDCLTKRFLVNDFKCSLDQLDIFGCFKNKSTVANNTQSSKIVSKQLLPKDPKRIIQKSNTGFKIRRSSGSTDPRQRNDIQNDQQVHSGQLLRLNSSNNNHNNTTSVGMDRYSQQRNVRPFNEMIRPNIRHHLPPLTP